MKKVEGLSTGIREEIKEYRENLGQADTGGIPESIIPAQRSYREATAPSLKEEEVKIERSEVANAEPMEVEPDEDADDGQIPALDDELGEDTDANVSEAEKAEKVEKRINKIMSYVTKVYHPEPSRLIMKDEKQFVLPPWAKGRNTAKCTFC